MHYFLYYILIIKAKRKSGNIQGHVKSVWYTMFVNLYYIIWMYTMAEVGFSFQRIIKHWKVWPKIHNYESQMDSVHPRLIIIIMTLHYFLKIWLLLVTLLTPSGAKKISNLQRFYKQLSVLKSHILISLFTFKHVLTQWLFKLLFLSSL